MICRVRVGMRVGEAAKAGARAGVRIATMAARFTRRRDAVAIVGRWSGVGEISQLRCNNKLRLASLPVHLTELLWSKWRRLLDFPHWPPAPPQCHFGILCAMPQLIEPSEFDLVVIGTGLVESIVAA